jgi:serine/threonine protein kinase/tetratricopeptide (TPR) repeat protein
MNEEEIFHQARARSPDEQPGFLEQACAGDRSLRAAVEALLRANVGATGFLEQPSPVVTVDVPPRENAGTVIGSYKLLEQIGEGGMGTVWMAQQTEPVKRVVALKLIKAGMDSKQVIARFEAERQALALMDHPNIARVLDGGTTESGRPYFVMDLVKGMPITKYCDEHHLTPRQRLELFVPVCLAIQHAHQKGIIHRDLKPSNVLVALYDGRPVPKVIDFGVAKAAGQSLTDKTLVTGFGNIVGTLEYMSPEQAEINQLDIDTRSDIYSLGVLLYELLAGSPPFTKKDLEKAGMLEMLRVIREQEPSKPSTKLSSSDTLPTLSANRGTEPARLTKLVRGELDWIVMKALEKDRARRYETANGFALDVQRYLADEAVQACPPSAGYRLRKLARRNKGGLAVAALVLFFLLLLGSGVGWAVRDRSAREAAIAQERANREVELTRERAARQAILEGKISAVLNEVKTRYENDELPEALAGVGSAEELIASGTEVRDELRQRVAAWRADLTIIEQLDDIYLDHAFLGVAFADAAYARVFRELGIPFGQLSVEEAGQRIRSRPARMRLAELLDQWADMLLEFGPVPTARREYLIRVARAADPDPLRTRVRLIAENWDLHEAERLVSSGDVERLSFEGLRQLTLVLTYKGGQSYVKTAIRLLDEGLARHPNDFRLARSLAGRHMGPASPKWSEVAHYLSIALAIRPRNVYIQVILAHAHRAQGKDEEAKAAIRRAILLEPSAARVHYLLGIALAEIMWKLEEAKTEFREALLLKPDFIEARFALAVATSKHGKVDDAVAEFRKYLAVRPNDAWAYSCLAQTLWSGGDLDGAIEANRAGIRVKPDDGSAHNLLACTLKQKGDLEGAIAEFGEAIRLQPDNYGPYLNLASMLLETPMARLRDPIRAVKLAEKAVELAPDEWLSWKVLGEARYRAEDCKGAIAALEKSLGVQAALDKSLGFAEGDPVQPSNWFFLAMAGWKVGDKEKARKWYDKAVQQADNEIYASLRAETEKVLELKK